MRSLSFFLVAMGVIGCGGGTTTTDAAAGNDAAPALDTGTPPVDTGTPPVDTGTPPIDTGTPPIDTGTPPTDTGASSAACSYVDTIDRSCTTDTDCHVGLHQTNCCGSSVMIGFRASEQSSYATSESACMASYPGCGCPAMLPTTDSGETVTDTSLVHAACVGVGPTMQCRTYVNMRPADGI